MISNRTISNITIMNAILESITNSGHPDILCNRCNMIDESGWPDTPQAWGMWAQVYNYIMQTMSALVINIICALGYGHKPIRHACLSDGEDSDTLL